MAYYPQPADGATDAPLSPTLTWMPGQAAVNHHVYFSESFDDVNDGATQFFFLTKESEVTPSGTNVLDGRWSVVGYAVDGAEGLADLNAGDVIESVREVR